MVYEEKVLLLERYYDACFWHAMAYWMWKQNKDSGMREMLDQVERELDRRMHEMDELRDTIEGLYELKGRKRTEDRKQVKNIMHVLWMTAENDAAKKKTSRKSHRALEEYFTSMGLKDDEDWRQS